MTPWPEFKAKYSQQPVMELVKMLYRLCQSMERIKLAGRDAVEIKAREAEKALEEVA